MKTQNLFIPKRILPEVDNMVIHSLSMRELSEINSLIEFMNYLEEVKKWSTKPANYFTQEVRFSGELTLEDIPLFSLEMTFLNQDRRRLNVLFLTSMDLRDFISSLEIRIVDLNLHQILESKGVPSNSFS
jgi:hypothetical protein